TYAGTTAATGSGDYLYVIQGDVLYSVNAYSGDYASLGGGYSESTEIAAYGGYVYCVWEGSLWKTSTADGSYEQLDSTWDGTTALCIL
ncbi:MAG: hypothetical protein GX465_18755, partial [Acidobacteria bacterium]|nr:hypothetical protein [Acidobacteriota bacterium]